jgi:hypothetical protein
MSLEPNTSNNRYVGGQLDIRLSTLTETPIAPSDELYQVTLGDHPFIQSGYLTEQEVRSLKSGIEDVPRAMLPPGWECRFSKLGNPYYIDHNTQSTTWVRPVYP